MAYLAGLQRGYRRRLPAELGHHVGVRADEVARCDDGRRLLDAGVRPAARRRGGTGGHGSLQRRLQQRGGRGPVRLPLPGRRRPVLAHHRRRRSPARLLRLVLPDHDPRDTAVHLRGRQGRREGLRRHQSLHGEPVRGRGR